MGYCLKKNKQDIKNWDILVGEITASEDDLLLQKLDDVAKTAGPSVGTRWVSSYQAIKLLYNANKQNATMATAQPVATPTGNVSIKSALRGIAGKIAMTQAGHQATGTIVGQ